MPNAPEHRARVAANVRAELARQGLKQVDVSAALGVPLRTLSRRLRAHSAFDVEDLCAIADLLEVPPGSLLDAS